MTALHPDRLTPASEADADAAFLCLSRLRDDLVRQNERVPAELVERAMQDIKEACDILIGRRVA